MLKDKGDYKIVEGFISAILKDTGYSGYLSIISVPLFDDIIRNELDEWVVL
ncbi:hypothetical protein A1E_03920 [Rickettsia canadensis str. McKiel]|uniref:Uncharacterized protein n=1 Tax=Rickettsia canadensis (strain McKiel) TaxID=293613 RepID=A8EZC8_RICCK|nr:hypothetical protein A1E_03920 [Rickettsia canadensis str. McKiel]